MNIEKMIKDEVKNGNQDFIDIINENAIETDKAMKRAIIAAVIVIPIVLYFYEYNRGVLLPIIEWLKIAAIILFVIFMGVGLLKLLHYQNTKFLNK